MQIFKKVGEVSCLTFPPTHTHTVVEAGPEGGACTVIRRGLLSGDSDWRAGSRPGRADVGEGSGPPCPRDRLAPGAG